MLCPQGWGRGRGSTCRLGSAGWLGVGPGAAVVPGPRPWALCFPPHAGSADPPPCQASQEPVGPKGCISSQLSCTKQAQNGRFGAPCPTPGPTGQSPAGLPWAHPWGWNYGWKAHCRTRAPAPYAAPQSGIGAVGSGPGDQPRPETWSWLHFQPHRRAVSKTARLFPSLPPSTLLVSFHTTTPRSNEEQRIGGHAQMGLAWRPKLQTHLLAPPSGSPPGLLLVKDLWEAKVQGSSLHISPRGQTQ